MNKTLNELIDEFNKEVKVINETTGETSPVRILNDFIAIRNTLSQLQDALVKRSLDNLKVGNN
jgi:hypothetical protein